MEAGRGKWSFLLLGALLLPGCRSHTELLESELRAKERDLRELREEMGRLEGHNEALQRELATGYQGSWRLNPEVASHTSSLRRISLGRGTGGYDQDHQLGDEALQIVLEPRDSEDHVIKAPGTLYVTALEINTEGIKTPFASWTVPPDQLRKSWKSGFFTVGYVLVLPWQTPPHQEQVRVVVRLETPDGRQFETDRDVRVVLRPEILRERSPLPFSPSPVTPLPPPRKLDIPPQDPGPSLPTPATWVPNEPGTWQAPTLQGAAQLCRPVALEGD
jgi:hypothetical protein